MACTQIIRKQILKKDIKEIWDFMSSPSNLENITPKSMDFQILSKNTDQKMYPGMIIKYKVTPLLYIPMTWVTEITHVKEKKYFRLGLKYLQESKNQFLFGIKPGLDYAFSLNTKWVFYYGFDLALVYQDNLQSERKYYESTIIPFFRAEYIISDSFSISTEPGLFFRLIQIEDYDNSPVDNSDSIFSSGIGQLGIININFSF